MRTKSIVVMKQRNSVFCVLQRIVPPMGLLTSNCVTSSMAHALRRFPFLSVKMILLTSRQRAARLLLSIAFRAPAICEMYPQSTASVMAGLGWKRRFEPCAALGIRCTSASVLDRKVKMKLQRRCFPGWRFAIAVHKRPTIQERQLLECQKQCRRWRTSGVAWNPRIVVLDDDKRAVPKGSGGECIVGAGHARVVDPLPFLDGPHGMLVSRSKTFQSP